MDKRILLVSCLIALAGAMGVLLHINQNNKKVADTTTQNSTQEVNNKDVREAVWKQLPASQQERITWQDGKLSKTTLAEGSIISDGNEIVRVDEYANKEVYMVDFPTDSMAVPNNVVVYADIETLTIIGYGLVD